MPSKFKIKSVIVSDKDFDMRLERNVSVYEKRCSLFLIAQTLVLFQLVSGFQPLIKNNVKSTVAELKRKTDCGFFSFKSSQKELLATSEEEYDKPPSAMLDDGIDFSQEELELLTVNQLKQQLRLRGLKVGGKKYELIMRLMGNRSELRDHDVTLEPDINSGEKRTTSKAQEFARSQGKDLVDVTDYLDDDDKNKETKSSSKGEEENQDAQEPNKSKSPETWGEEAKIVDDFEGRSVIVDNLSRTIVEFKGSESSKVQAYVVASRDSLKTYLAGGDRAVNSSDMSTAVKNIQLAREKANKVPMRLEDQQGEDVDDEEGLYTKVLDRDYGDYGDYSMTGAQLSAQEVKGVLLLSDVYGPFSEDTKILVEKIAFECQPVVVFAPDLFRGKNNY